MSAVVWCVMPTPRMDAVLQEQASFIDQFITDDEDTPENEGGKIWSNVVIVCKGKLSPALAGDVQGALLAAKHKYIHATPLAIRSDPVPHSD